MVFGSVEATLFTIYREWRRSTTQSGELAEREEMVSEFKRSCRMFYTNFKVDEYNINMIIQFLTLDASVEFSSDSITERN